MCPWMFIWPPLESHFQPEYKTISGLLSLRKYSYSKCERIDSDTGKGIACPASFRKKFLPCAAGAGRRNPSTLDPGQEKTLAGALWNHHTFAQFALSAFGREGGLRRRRRAKSAFNSVHEFSSYSPLFLHSFLSFPS